MFTGKNIIKIENADSSVDFNDFSPGVYVFENDLEHRSPYINSGYTFPKNCPLDVGIAGPVSFSGALLICIDTGCKPIHQLDHTNYKQVAKSEYTTKIQLYIYPVNSYAGESYSSNSLLSYRMTEPDTGNFSSKWRTLYNPFPGRNTSANRSPKILYGKVSHTSGNTTTVFGTEIPHTIVYHLLCKIGNPNTVYEKYGPGNDREQVLYISPTCPSGEYTYLAIIT